MGWLDDGWVIHQCTQPWDDEYTRLDLGRRWQCDACGSIWRLDEVEDEYIRGRRIRFLLDDVEQVHIPDGSNAVVIDGWVHVQRDRGLEPLLSRRGRMLSPAGEEGPLPDAS